MSAPLLTHFVSGQGEPVLLLNGGAMTMAAWEPIAAPLAATHRIVRCDLRGQLLSPGPSHPTLDAHAADIVALLDALSLPRVHAVGTSFGALVGLVLAARHPDRVQSLVAGTTTDVFTVDNWNAGQDVVEACRAAAEGRGDGGRVTDLLSATTFSERFMQANAALFSERRTRVAALPAQYFAGLLGILESLKGLDLRPLLPTITARTLVIGAENDRTFSVERSHALARAIPNATLTVIPGAAHGVFVEEPQRVLPLLQAFLGT